jgi:hypothetical protein
MGRGKKNKHYVVVRGWGDPCPKCCQPTQIREHDAITEKHRRQPFYFTRWFYCVNPACKTSMVMVERYKVWNAHVKEKEVREYAQRGEVVWGDTWADRPQGELFVSAHKRRITENPPPFEDGDTSGPAPWE